MRLRLLQFHKEGDLSDQYIWITKNFTSDYDDYNTPGYHLVNDGFITVKKYINVSALPLDQKLIMEKK